MLARGRVVVVLVCDHELTAICDASEECINVLLDRKVIDIYYNLMLIIFSLLFFPYVLLLCCLNNEVNNPLC